jgi:hypothetical protein
MKASSSKKSQPNLPASSRLKAPSGGGTSTKPVKSMVKGNTKTKMKGC